MALQASGTIKYSQIITEFGTPNNGGLGEFRLGGGEDVGSLSDVPLDVGVPVSGQIKFSDFYSKRLNQIVDLHSIGNNTVRQDAKDRWNNGNVHIVGSSRTGKTQPPDTIDDRIIINVNNTIGSAQGTQTHCALKTGTWDSGTTLVIEIGPSGKLYGSGGKGGDGGSASGGQGDNGETGSSALGIQYACTVNNLGVIQSGYGGGGGGGAGLPAGGAGICPDGAFGGGTNGSDGQPGSLSGQATGGLGGNYGADGGDSSPVNNSATKGDDGEVDNSTGGHGTGGSNGYAIVTNQGSAPSISGGGSITGRTATSTNPT